MLMTAPNQLQFRPENASSKVLGRLMAWKNGWKTYQPLTSATRAVAIPEKEVQRPKLTDPKEQGKWNLKLIQATTTKEAEDALTHGANINCYVKNDSLGIDSASVLIFAVIEKRSELFDFYLTEPGVDIDRKDSNGFSAVMRAEVLGQIEMVAKLRARGAGYTEEDKKTVYELKLIRAKTVEEARDALAHGADINCYVQKGQVRSASVLLLSVTENKSELFDFYVEQPGIDINRKDNYGFSAIMRADFLGQIEMVAKLRAKGAVYTKEDEKKVWELRLIRAKTVEEARDALAHGADINCVAENPSINVRDGSVLIFAVLDNNQELFDFYVEQPGINLQKRATNGWNALMDAVHSKRKKMEKKLREKGCTLSADEEDAVRQFKAYTPKRQ
ncbi:Ankyrin repeats (3 copies) [Candidatus Bilamarchaeum dharawalense]|uniref:Ankyrin repeats (3 copies) n=1 Tax=Candidatus Bilamarchaeum dharawalense TaxID=2885759 RepID=A0A5E4LS11_9ARCH|nr:Ankyrin repeats (3 copies) [Candidatus Bilamarchaeum dharawalense]